MRRWDLICVGCALVAVTLWIAGSSIHRFHNSDTLVGPLISLYHWTPLYWEHNRVGMLIPLLAVPFRAPFINLLVQCGLGIGGGLASFFLLGYYVAGRRRGLLIGALGSLWFVLLDHLEQQFDYFITNSHYSTSLALALLALLALQRWELRSDAGRIRWWRPIFAVGWIWLALWVNPSLAFALGPLILMRRFLSGDAARKFDRFDDGPSDACALSDGPLKGTLLRLLGRYPAADIVALSATATGLMISMAISRWAATFQEHYAFLPPVDWLACATDLCRNLPEVMHKNWLLAVMITAVAGLPTLRWPVGRQALRSSLNVTLALLIPALVQFAFMTSLNVVHECNRPRYVFVAAMLWQAGCLAFCVLQWTVVLPDNPRLRSVPYVCLFIFCLVAMARHGRSGLDVARQALDQNAGPMTDEVLSARCTHVTGDYWHVWNVVYHANRRLADRGAPYTVWGICQRCLPTADQWTKVPLAETRIAMPIGDEQIGEAYLAQYVASPVILDRVGRTIRVLRPTVALSEAGPVQVRR